MELLYCCLSSGDATCGQRWLFDANFKLQAARWAETGYMLIMLFKFFVEFPKKELSQHCFSLGFLPKLSLRSILKNSRELLSSIYTGFDISEVVRIKTFSPKIAGYHLEIKAFKCVGHSSGISFVDVTGVSLWYRHFEVKIQRFKDQHFPLFTSFSDDKQLQFVGSSRAPICSMPSKSVWRGWLPD